MIAKITSVKIKRANYFEFRRFHCKTSAYNFANMRGLLLLNAFTAASKASTRCRSFTVSPSGEGHSCRVTTVNG